MHIVHIIPLSSSRSRDVKRERMIFRLAASNSRKNGTKEYDWMQTRTLTHTGQFLIFTQCRCYGFRVLYVYNTKLWPSETLKLRLTQNFDSIQRRLECNSLFVTSKRRPDLRNLKWKMSILKKTKGMASTYMKKYKLVCHEQIKWGISKQPFHQETGHANEALKI